MGEVSGRLADLTIITSDNPRFEEPLAIMEDIKTGINRTTGKHIDIADRKEAIKYAIENGEPGDIIVLAGKGHEDYQEIKGVKYPMDERVLISEVLEELKEKMYADIIIDISHEQLDKTFQYAVPDDMDGSVDIGTSVRVPFGKVTEL